MGLDEFSVDIFLIKQAKRINYVGYINDSWAACLVIDGLCIVGTTDTKWKRVSFLGNIALKAGCNSQ